MPRVLNKRTGLEHAVGEGHWSLTHPNYEIVDAPKPAPSLTDLTIAELREYASENGIDLGTATRKADILALLE